MSVCYKCCVLLVRGLADELISRLEESNRRWCVAVCDLEALIMRRAWPNGCFAPEKKIYLIYRQLDKQRGTINLHKFV